MKRKMGMRWHLRERMAAAGMWKTSDLVGPLADRGVVLSREQVYRLVTGQPERLNMHVLVALCDILDCGPSDLIEPVVQAEQVRKRAAAGQRRSGGPSPASGTATVLRPVRARITSDTTSSTAAPPPAGDGATPGEGTGPADDPGRW